MNVDQILDDVIRKEGGFVNNPRDSGGATNMGITIGTLSQYYGRRATVDEVRNLTVETVKEIYTREYVMKPMFHTLPEGVQAIAVDTGILFGPNKATKFMQSIVNQAGFGPVNEDGVLGNLSRSAIFNAFNQMGSYFVDAIVEERIMFHRMRVQQQPDQEIFLQGWVNRAETFRINR